MNKNIFVKIIVVLGLFFIISPRTYADTYMYTKRDSILRNNYSNKYTADAILKDGVKIAVIKGTKVKIISKVNDYYYKVMVEADGVFYLKNRTGYIISKSLTDGEVKKDSYEDRTLSVSDKTTLLKNVMTLVNSKELSNGNINILYPTANAISKENVESKDYLRTAGYNFIVNGIPFESKRTKLNNGNNYYLSCSAFVGALYNGTFGINVIKDNGSLYWAPAYYTYGANANKGNLFTVVKSVKNIGEKLGNARKMQIGDSIMGRINANKLPTEQGYTYSSNQAHIMMYIGDALIAHSTDGGLKITYYDKKSKNGVSNYYLTLGERSIKNDKNEIVTPGYRFDKEIYLLRIKKGTKRTRRRINISDDKKGFVLVETIKK